MEDTRTALAQAQAWEEGRPSVGGQPRGLRGDPVDLEIGRALEGSSRRVSQSRNSSASSQQVGRGGRVGGSAARVPTPTQIPRFSLVAGVVHRRDIHASKKGGLHVGNTRKGKGTKLVVVASGEGVPIGILTAPANPHESHLAEEALRSVRVPRKGRGRPRTTPSRLIGDKAYGASPKLRKRLRRRGIDLIAPGLSNRPNIQDGRKLRRYKRRWIIERTNSWFNTACRRLTTPIERSLTVFTGFIHVAIIMICLRRL